MTEETLNQIMEILIKNNHDPYGIVVLERVGPSELVAHPFFKSDLADSDADFSEHLLQTELALARYRQTFFKRSTGGDYTTFKEKLEQLRTIHIEP